MRRRSFMDSRRRTAQVIQAIFQGVRVPWRPLFDVAENLEKGIDLIIARPKIDSWDIIFTPEGLRPHRTAIEFELI